MEAHGIVLKDTVLEVNPGISITQQAGPPPAQAAAGEMEPGGDRHAHPIAGAEGTDRDFYGGRLHTGIQSI